MRWDFTGSPTDSEFTFKPPEGAKQVALVPLLANCLDYVVPPRSVSNLVANPPILDSHRARGQQTDVIQNRPRQIIQKVIQASGRSPQEGSE